MRLMRDPSPRLQRAHLKRAASCAPARWMLIAGMVVVAAACSSSTHKESSSTTSSTSGSTTTTTAPADASLLLTAQDLPTGWLSKAGDGTFSGYCGTPTPAQRAAGAGVASASFTDGGADGAQLSEQVFVFPDEDGATQLMAGIRDSSVGCSSWDEPVIGQSVNVTPTALDVPTVGDESTATRLAFTANGHTATTAYAFVRRGPVVIGLALGGPATDTGNLETFMGTAAAKA
jgi:hypothetical protein